MGSPAIDYDALAKRAGAISSQPAQIAGPQQSAQTPDYDAMAKQTGAISSEPHKTDVFDHVADTLKQYWHRINPVTGAQALFDAARHPGDAAQGYGAQTAKLGQAAIDAFHQGDIPQGIRHTLSYFLNGVPGIGSSLDEAGNKAKAGDFDGAIADTAALATNLYGPHLIAKGLNALPATVSTPSLVKANLSPENANAVRFADSEGIPIDAATRTGSKVIRNVQTMAQNQPIASGIATRAQADTRAGLAHTGEQLADEAHPQPSTPESAGAGVAKLLADLSDQQRKGSTGAYGKLEKIEALPQHQQTFQPALPAAAAPFDPTAAVHNAVPVAKTVALPVDMGPAIEQLRPVLDRLKMEMPLAQQQASRGLQAVDNIVNGDRIQPASVADQNLSALKQLQREAVNPKTLRLANQAVSAVAPLVDRAVAGAGPDALDALNEGRALTKAKYATDATIDQLPVEPVKLFDKLTAQRDTSINLVRDVAQKAPGAIPALGRAYLEGLFERATSDAGKPGAGASFSQWNKLGDSTKGILFPDATLRGKLDDFFTLAKNVSENPNPSGTAHVASSLVTLSEGGLMLHNPVAGLAALLSWPAVTKMLYSRGGADLLLRGMKIPLASASAKFIAPTIVRAAAGANLGAQGLPVAAKMKQTEPVQQAFGK